MIPDEARRVLEPFMGNLPWENINLHVGRLPIGADGQLAYALIPRAVMAISAPRAFRALKTAAVTMKRDIFIVPEHANMEDAAGLSLLAHELVHVKQGEVDPQFLARYSELAAHTAPDRPWENPFEMQAYQKERQVYCSLVARGVPKGKWVPLGVTLWGC